MISAMDSTAVQSRYPVRMLVADWLYIDATLDNHIQTSLGGEAEDEAPDGEAAGQAPDEPDDEQESDGPDDGSGDDGGGGAQDDWDWDGEEFDEEPDDSEAELPPVVRLGMSIRQAGWDHLPDWPQDAAGLADLPAPGRTMTMTLTGEQWELVGSALHTWAAVDDRTGDAEGARRSLAIAAAVKEQLAEQGHRIS
jgi:hypothetical protein